MKKEKSVFEVLSAVNVSDKVEKKGNLSYLSWAWAWGEDLPAPKAKPQLSKSDLEAVLKGTIENARKVLSEYDISDEYKNQITNKFKK